MKRFYISFDKINGYIEDNNGSKYLTLVPIDENKGESEKAYIFLDKCFHKLAE